MTPDVRVTDGRAALFDEAAALVAETIRESVAARGVCRLALSGGTTPRGLHARLAHNEAHRDVPWGRVDVFWGDDRHVPPDHPDSNYGMARDTLLAHVPVDPARVHRIPAEEADAAAAAEAYERTLRTVFEIAPGQWPRFDLMIQGIGADGHTASIFPGTTALEERERLFVSVWVPKLGAHRLTMTLPVFNHAATILFLVDGVEKAEAVKAALAGPSPEAPPAALIRPEHGRLIWLLDRTAGALL